MIATHWAKDPLCPYAGCKCVSCQEAPTNEIDRLRSRIETLENAICDVYGIAGKARGGVVAREIRQRLKRFAAEREARFSDACDAAKARAARQEEV